MSTDEAEAPPVSPEMILRALAHTARQHGGFSPSSPAAAVMWAVDEIERLRTTLGSRTPDKTQWEHAAQLLHRWVSDIRWCSASDSLRQRSRTRVAQIGVELGLVDT